MAVSAGAANFDGASEVEVDSSGNIYVTGGFELSVDFDPGPGSQIAGSVGGRDAFVWKLDSAGNLIWVETFGSSGFESASCAAIDSTGTALYVGGTFEGTADFGGTVLTSAGLNDIFVAKLDAASGGPIWARAMGGPSIDTALALARDSNDNVYTTGYFNGTADFDPGPGTANRTSAGLQDVFVSKLDGAGNFVSVAHASGPASQDVGNGIAVDSGDNVYVTGVFYGTVDFDPGPSTAFLNSHVPSGTFVDADAFVWKLDSAGNFASVRLTGGPELSLPDQGRGIAVDASGEIVSVGNFAGSADFDTGASVASLVSAGQTDTFVLRTVQATPTTPQLLRLIDSPDPGPKNGTLTLSTQDIRIVAGGSNVASVSFYRDKNGNGTLQVGTDTFLGTDTNGSNGWSLTTTAPNKNGIYTYFAQAKDSSNVAGNVVSARNRVGPGGPVASMISSRDRAAAGVDLVLDRYYTDDREDRNDSASPSHLSARSLAELLRTRSRR